jgi:hypothetical protein
MRLGKFPILLLILGLLFSSCEKKESAITLPPKTTAQINRVDMGEDYGEQIFFDFETGLSVKTSKVNSWDLAFESSPTGYHVFMNGGKNIFVYNTQSTNASSIQEVNALLVDEAAWRFDAPCGLPDSTGVGDWRDGAGNSKKEVFIVKLMDGSYRKIVIDAVTDSSYVLSYGDINSTSLSTIIIPKYSIYNYSYFSFDNGGTLVNPEPPKETWDIVFTRYRYIYYDLNNFPYLVSGVLLNPYQTYGTADSSTSFTAITYSSAAANEYTNQRDVIGFDWKTFDFGTYRYNVKQNKCYVIKTRKKQYWKIHFLDFYSSAGLKGSPSFEYERIQ